MELEKEGERPRQKHTIKTSKSDFTRIDPGPYWWDPFDGVGTPSTGLGPFQRDGTHPVGRIQWDASSGTHPARCILQDASCKTHPARRILQDASCETHPARRILRDASCETHPARRILWDASKWPTYQHLVQYFSSNLPHPHPYRRKVINTKQELELCMLVNALLLYVLLFSLYSKCKLSITC